jgi:transmembrane secretion effector
VTLGGLQLNISGILGPILGGALIPLIGADFVFVVNAACFVFVILAVLSWKGATARSRLPLDSFLETFPTGIRYVRYETALQIVLARNALLALCISVIPSLMPVVGLKVLCLSPSCLGLLFTSMGAGSVVAALAIIPWLRARYAPNSVTVLANLLVLLVYLSMALARQRELFFFRRQRPPQCAGVILASESSGSFLSERCDAYRAHSPINSLTFGAARALSQPGSRWPQSPGSSTTVAWRIRANSMAGVGFTM